MGREGRRAVRDLLALPHLGQHRDGPSEPKRPCARCGAPTNGTYSDGGGGVRYCSAECRRATFRERRWITALCPGCHREYRTTVSNLAVNSRCWGCRLRRAGDQRYAT